MSQNNTLSLFLLLLIISKSKKYNLVTIIAKQFDKTLIKYTFKALMIIADKPTKEQDAALFSGRKIQNYV